MSLRYHFDDCPYFCNEQGKLLDTQTGKMIPCPHCSEKRKQLMQSEIRKGNKESDEDTLLGLRSFYHTDNFNYEEVIPEPERVFITPESMQFQQKEAEKLYNNLVLGIAPKSSYCYGIGIKGRIDRFLYPMMVKAFKSGLTVAKFCTAFEFTRLLLIQDDSLDTYYTADIVFIAVNTGSVLSDVNNVKGLMETRGLQGKPTILVTTWKVEACNGLLWYESQQNENEEEEDILYMAKPVFVKYSNKNARNKYTRSILHQKERKEDVNNINHQLNGNIGVDNEILEQDMIEEDGGVSLFEL